MRAGHGHARARLDLVCNGAGAERHAREAGVDADPLLGALLSRRDDFGWINHTYEHVNLDLASGTTIEAEIARNRRWAGQLGIDLELAYAAATRDQTFDQLRHLGRVDVPSWPDVEGAEAARIFTTMMSNG